MADMQNVTTQSDEPQKPAKRKWGVVRIIIVTLLSLLTLAVLALSAVIIWLGPIVEEVVENNDKELLGRSVTMDNLEVKLFSGYVGVDNLVVYEDDDISEFVRVGRFEVEMEIMELLDNAIHLSRVMLRDPSVAVVQTPDSFNFDTLIDYVLATYTSEEAVEEESGEPWAMIFENISLEGGAVAYNDVELDQQWTLQALAVSTPLLNLDDVTSIHASTTINDRATLAGDVDVNCSTFDFVFDGELLSFNIADTYKYIHPVINTQRIEGAVSAKCRIEGNAMNILASEISGEIGAENFVLLGPDGGNIFSAESFAMAIDRVNVEQQVYHLASVTANGYSTQFCLEKDGTTNFSELFYSDPEVSVESTAKEVSDDMYDVKERVTVTTDQTEAPLQDMDLTIAKLSLRGGKVRYADNTMHRPFDYTVSEIAIRANDFKLMEKNRISVRAQLPKQGSAMIQWEGALDDFYNQSLSATLSNVDIQSLSTFVEYYTSFPVTSGNLTFRSQNEVSNGRISGVNQLGTYNFTVGDKIRKHKPEYRLPVRLGIFVLTDRDKHIDIELPISGDISSPEFSLRKVIWKAIGNVILKVVASPFEWMSGDKQDAFRHIDIDLTAPGLASEHYARIDTMVNTLKADTTLAVRLKPRINYKRAARTLSDMSLKMAYYNATQGEQEGYLDMLDFARIKDMKLSGREISKFADSMLIARGIDPSTMTNHAKADALYGDKVDEQLVRIVNMRNGIIARYVAFQHKELPRDKFVLTPITIEDIKGYTGKDKYAVMLVIGDDEVEVATKDESEEDASATEGSQGDVTTVSENNTNIENTNQ